jgi:hypothetical protein
MDDLSFSTVPIHGHRCSIVCRRNTYVSVLFQLCLLEHADHMPRDEVKWPGGGLQRYGLDLEAHMSSTKDWQESHSILKRRRLCCAGTVTK